MWIHEHKDWPNFTWNIEKLTDKLTNIRFQQGHLLGRMQDLGFGLIQEANLNTLVNDVVQTSAIEGENLNPEEVRSSIAQRLGMDTVGLSPASRDVEGIVELMLDATQQYFKPLTKNRLFDWYSALFPTGLSGIRRIIIGNWRTLEQGPMQVVSGPIGQEKVHFEAPSADRLEKEMQIFLKWFDRETSIDSILKASIAHFWFVTIHPFEDGNGRIARAISDMALARADGVPERFYSMSTQIMTKRKEYYNQLEKHQRNNLEITDWLVWFLDCLGQSYSESNSIINRVLFKKQLWNKVNQKSVNDRQRLIINRMLADDFEGFMNTSKFAKMAKCSTDTALRDIQELKERNIFIQNPGSGRSTSYRLTDLSESRKSE